MRRHTRPPRWLFAFFANTVLIRGITFVLRPTAIYRAIELDVPAAWLGALGASFAVVPLVLALPSGQAADRYGERRVMVVGGVLTLAAALTFAFAGGTVAGLLGACALLGTGHLGCMVSQQALVANRIERAGYDKAFGRYTFAASTGQAIGPGLIVLLGGGSTIPDTAAIFGWTTGLSVLPLATALLLPRTAAGAAVATAEAGGVRDLLRRPGLVRALTISCLILAAVDISLVYLPLLGTETGISAGIVGALLALRAGASMVSRFFLGQLAERLGRGRLLTGSIVLSALTMALLPTPMPEAALAVVVVVLGLGLGVGQPLTMSWLAEATPAGLRGRAMSLRLTGNRLGQVLVPSTAGFVAAGAGAAGVLWCTALALGAAAVGSRDVWKR
ncbi:MFS transporter [Nocardioides okcheonensis]|uniref:MFS transporter n=1 Tax=Nocardioides okcheonensis TaxID=2894081 RepID=UPI001E3E69FF|nr:MFS transporter [Nocardioides okcheonensis]UFN46497.1 MFS transporter [Nocardioides okcheonensis]